MTFNRLRRAIAFAIYPEARRVDYDFWKLHGNIELAERWLTEFPSICDTLDWVRGRRNAGESHMHGFRERLRKMRGPKKV